MAPLGGGGEDPGLRLRQSSLPAAAYGWCAEPSIYLRPEAQGKHIGRQLYGALEELLRQMGYILSFAVITGENSGSLAFHQAQATASADFSITAA